MYIIIVPSLENIKINLTHTFFFHILSDYIKIRHNRSFILYTLLHSILRIRCLHLLKSTLALTYSVLKLHD
jgi:hypothetical protein